MGKKSRSLRGRKAAAKGERAAQVRESAEQVGELTAELRASLAHQATDLAAEDQASADAMRAIPPSAEEGR